jgi:ribosome biogenesis protein UTP30
MAKDQLIDSHVSEKQAKLAIKALYNHAKKRQAEQEEKELLPGKEAHVWLQVAVKRIHAEKKLKPQRM